VTLQPSGPRGQIPGDASDPADFYGIVAALLVIAVVVLAVRLLFRGRGRTEEAPRSQ